MEQFFYCKYGVIGPICSDCKRNHINSPYETSDITTWLSPNHIKTNGKGCTDYVPIKESTMVNKQEFIENTLKWLKEHVRFEVVAYSDVWDTSVVDVLAIDFDSVAEMEENFRKAMTMEEQQ